ncbi:MAG: hypothetical protein JWM65_2965 [Sphingomonas bacterium]|nr:hypothetical protein [Sphingomonas bacterium]
MARLAPMPLGWWLRASVAPIVIFAILLGLGWLVYATTAPSDQHPAIVTGKVVGLRLEAVSRLRGGTQVLVVVALRDGSRATVPITVGAAAVCHIGSAIALDQYTNHLGHEFLSARAHPCG